MHEYMHSLFDLYGACLSHAYADLHVKMLIATLHGACILCSLVAEKII